MFKKISELVNKLTPKEKESLAPLLKLYAQQRSELMNQSNYLLPTGDQKKSKSVADNNLMQTFRNLLDKSGGKNNDTIFELTKEIDGLMGLPLAGSANYKLRNFYQLGDNVEDTPDYGPSNSEMSALIGALLDKEIYGKLPEPSIAKRAEAARQGSLSPRESQGNVPTPPANKPVNSLNPSGNTLPASIFGLKGF